MDPGGSVILTTLWLLSLLASKSNDADLLPFANNRVQVIKLASMNPPAYYLLQLKRKKVRPLFHATIVALSVRFTPATATPWLRAPAGGRVEKKIKKGFLM
jgi:hypothetical protein